MTFSFLYHPAKGCVRTHQKFLTLSFLLLLLPKPASKHHAIRRLDEVDLNGG